MTVLEDALKHYGIKGKVLNTVEGPLVKQIQFQPEAGTKLKNIQAVLPDIARETGLKGLRLSSFCEGGCIGFEVSVPDPKTVDLEALLESNAFEKAFGALPLSLGVTITGQPVFADLAKMPHLLVAGATGSGKSVGLNAFILSLMKRKTPEELKFVLIDPKRIEFSMYNRQKYMYMPVITDNADAEQALALLVEEMNKRYKIFEETGVKNIAGFVAKGQKMPYIVAIVDEFSDLVLMQKEVARLIQILAQKARAAGIHLILTTQRPSVDVVTGSIKANFPARLAFKTASGVDSKTILDTPGAEGLIGRGDALYLAADGTLTRVHGAYIPDDKIEAFLKPFLGEVPDILPKKEKQLEEPSHKKEAPKSKKTFSIWKMIVGCWNYLGKRLQKKLILGLISLILASKTSAKKKR